MKRTLVWAVAVALALGALGGCATRNLIRGAQQSLDQARTADAETKAPYEYHAASGYLDHARHEYSEGDGSAARSFAEESVKFSEQALKKAKGGAE